MGREMEGELSRLHGVGVAKHQKGIQASFLPAKDVYAAEFLPVTFKAVLEMLDPLASVARLVNIAHLHSLTPVKTSAATSFDAAAGLAALTKHGIGLVTVRYYNISFGDCGIGFYGRQNCDNCAKMTKSDGGSQP